jgi:excisionase family DNA binding protein
MNKRFLTAKETADELGFKVARVYDLVEQGILPAVHFGHHIRIERSKLEEFIAQGGKRLERKPQEHKGGRKPRPYMSPEEFRKIVKGA